MKRTIGILLWLTGHAINLLVLLAAAVYLFGAVIWMHAPLLGALVAGAPMALPALGLAWLCTRFGKRLRDDVPAPARSPAKRWLLAGVAVVALGACAMLVRSGVKEYECQAGRSRNGDGGQLEARRDGFERVCPGDLERFDVGFLPEAIATHKLALTPVDLSHTPFAQLEGLGRRAETVGDVRSRLYRGFRLPDGHRLTLFEQDMSADGSTSWRDPKDEPERINGLAARLVVLQDPSGKAVSLLSWMEGRRDYQLWIDANVVREPLRERLFALAASLPHAVPACPNEPPPRPADEPMPQVSTRAQVDAMLDISKRPCK